MIHWNRKRYRSLLLAQIVVLFVFTTAMIATFSESRLSSELPELELVRKAKIDLKEISGLSLMNRQAESPQIIAVGDKEARLVFWGLDDWQTESKSFTKLMIDHFSLCRDASERRCKKMLDALLRDWEAIAVDGNGQIFLVQEYSESLLVLSADLQRVVSIMNYSFDEALPSLKNAKKKFRSNAKGEGVILLKQGHFIVAKESDPPALVEFGPAGHEALGLSSQTLLAPGEAFVLPQSPAQDSPLAAAVTRFDYRPLHVWSYEGRAGHAKCDISDLAVSPSGLLFLLSQSCGQLKLLQGLATSHSKLDVLASYNVSREVRNPEAIVALSDTEVIVASDTKKSGANVFQLRLPLLPKDVITTH